MDRKKFGLLGVVVLAIVAFAWSVHLMLGSEDAPVYHEITWDTRTLAAEMVDKIKHDNNVFHGFASVDSSGKQAGPLAVADTARILGALQVRIAGLNDSMWNAYIVPRMFVVPESINAAKNLQPASLNNVAVVYTDTSFPLRRYTFTTALPVRTYQHFRDFITKYPIFGAWALLIAIQITVNVLLIAWLVFMLFDDNKLETQLKVIYIGVIFLVCALLYYMIFMSGHASEDLSKDQYFMFGLSHAFKYVNVLGYVSAGLCISGMMFCILQGSDMRTGTPSNDDIKALDEQFKLYFTLVAIVLSLAVFTTGTLFSALNSLDMVKQLTRAQGYSPVPTDYVFLYGLIHSFVLMLFYIPARFMMAQLKSKMVPAPPPEDWSQLKKLGGLAVAGSPLLAGMFQSLIDVLSK